MAFLGSISGLAREEVEEHITRNSEWNQFKYSLFRRVLAKTNHSAKLVLLLAGYFTFVFLLYFLLEENEFLPTIGVEHWVSANNIALGIQATLLGIFFPVALAIVGLILTSGYNLPQESRIEIYQNEALVWETGVSSFGFIIVSAVFLFTPLLDLAKLELSDKSAHILLVSTATGLGLWLLINLIFFLNFFWVSLRFVSNRFQLTYLKKFFARKYLRDELFNKIRNLYWLAAWWKNRLVGANNPSNYNFQSLNPEVCTGSLFKDQGHEVIKKNFPQPHVLSDIYLDPLNLAIKLWLKRVQKENAKNTPTQKPLLIFPLRFDLSYKGDFCLCRIQGNTTLTVFEKLLIGLSFRFRKEKL